MDRSSIRDTFKPPFGDGSPRSESGDSPSKRVILSDSALLSKGDGGEGDLLLPFLGTGSNSPEAVGRKSGGFWHKAFSSSFSSLVMTKSLSSSSLSVAVAAGL